MFEVTYVNEHTCHELRASDDDAAAAAARMASPWTTSRRHALAGAVDTARGHGHGAGSAEENEAMVSCLAAVVSGSVPPPPSSGWPPAPEASASDPDAAGRSATVADDGAMMTTMMMVDDTGFSWDPWWSLCPVEEAAAGHQLVVMNPANHHRDDMHMDKDDAGGFADTVWPEHTCGAWRRA